MFCKEVNCQKQDITFDYFEHYKNVPDVNIIHPIKYSHSHQYINYANLDFTSSATACGTCS